MRRVAVITGGRAEYSQLRPLLRAIADDDELALQLIVCGMHLSPEFGLTYREIESDGFEIADRIEMLLSSDTPVGIGKSMGIGTIGFTDSFSRLRPDLVVVLGDRFEILSAAAAAMVARIPIAHIHGGEATEGLIDEAIRHAVTKMAHMHFTSTMDYRRRVIQMGEDPSHVFCVGALAIDNILSVELLERTDLERALGLALTSPTFMVTFHPVTLEAGALEEHVDALLRALDEFPEAKIVVTKPNADTEGRTIIRRFEEYAAAQAERVRLFTSLGDLNYLSCLKHFDVMIGNSSSGLVEAPHFRLPTVNIGDRQRGRMAPRSVIHCPADTGAIVVAIRRALTAEFRHLLADMENLYGDGRAAAQIKDTLKSMPLDESLLKKRFYDLPGQLQ